MTFGLYFAKLGLRIRRFIANLSRLWKKSLGTFYSVVLEFFPVWYSLQDVSTPFIHQTDSFWSVQLHCFCPFCCLSFSSQPSHPPLKLITLWYPSLSSNAQAIRLRFPDLQLSTIVSFAVGLEHLYSCWKTSAGNLNACSTSPKGILTVFGICPVSFSSLGSLTSITQVFLSRWSSKSFSWIWGMWVNEALQRRVEVFMMFLEVHFEYWKELTEAKIACCITNFWMYEAHLVTVRWERAILEQNQYGEEWWMCQWVSEHLCILRL